MKVFASFFVTTQAGKREISEAKAFFFEKKKQKTFSYIAAGTEFERANSVLSETDKSFLVLAAAACDPLFSKKNNACFDFHIPGLASSVSGNQTENVAPLPSSLSISNWPR